MTTNIQEWVDSIPIYTGPNRTHKQCFICKDWKPLGDYYRPQRDSYCKECNRANSKARLAVKKKSLMVDQLQAMCDAHKAKNLACLPDHLQEYASGFDDIATVEDLITFELGWIEDSLNDLKKSPSLEAELDGIETSASIIRDCVDAIRKRDGILD